MRRLTIVAIVLSIAFLSGCETTQRDSKVPPSTVASSTEKSVDQEQAKSGQLPSAAKAPQGYAASSGVHTPNPAFGGGGGGGRNRGSLVDATTVSLASIGTVYAESEAIDRKIIRNGELAIETESPNEGLRKITLAAESHGGFVVTSEFKQNPTAPGAKPNQSVTVVARVPSSAFAATLEQIRGVGDRVVQEKISGQDVSEEYLDVQARLRNKKALEGQFLDIMKQARKVEDALEVQSQLADVRTDIERLEGRRRFLDNQSALSTITTTLQMPQPIIATSTSGFGATVKRAFGDSIDVAASILLFVIQAVIVLIPVAFFFGLPAWILWRSLRRRLEAMKRAEPSPIPSK